MKGNLSRYYYDLYLPVTTIITFIIDIILGITHFIIRITINWVSDFILSLTHIHRKTHTQ